MSQLSIAITTRNRWSALRGTLSRLARDYPDLAVMLVDDGSNQPCPYDPGALHPRVDFRVHPQSAGLICRRNELNERATTPFVLSLDDDSYPAEGSLDAALGPLGDPRTYCVSLPVFNPVQDVYQNPPRSGPPSPCRAFVGCGHIMKRAAFLELGGYTGMLVHQGEEHDLGARAHKRGWRAVHFAACLIHHLETNEGRSLARMDYYGARNAVFWNDWYVPDEAQTVFRIRRVAATLKHAVQTGRAGQIRGHLAALAQRRRFQHHRDRMSSVQFAAWRELPFA